MDASRRIALGLLAAASAFATSALATTAWAQPTGKASTRIPADNRPPESVTSARMLTLIRENHPQQARSIGAQYITVHPGTPRTGEHCMILVAFAYADLLLEHRDESQTVLGVFDKGCARTAVRDEYRAEVKRIRRVLNGELLAKVYPSGPSNPVPP